MKKNAFFTFVAACIPGFGQMYYGFMRRGLSVGFWFCAVLALALFFKLTVIVLFLPLLWAFSFFDTFNIRSLTPAQYNALSDGFVPEALWEHALDFKKTSTGKPRKYIGVGLLVLGVLVLYSALITQNSQWQSLVQIPILGFFLQALPGLVVGLVVIIMGISLLRGRRPDFVNKLEDAVFSEDEAGVEKIKDVAISALETLNSLKVTEKEEDLLEDTESDKIDILGKRNLTNENINSTAENNIILQPIGVVSPEEEPEPLEAEPEPPVAEPEPLAEEPEPLAEEPESKEILDTVEISPGENRDNSLKKEKKSKQKKQRKK